METTDLTVITLTRGTPQVLSMCLSHLELQTYPSAKFEVIVVVLPSADNTDPMLDRFCTGGPVRMRCIYARGEHTGVARNLGVMQAQGRWLLFLDEDLLAGSHLIENHIETQRLNGNACAVVGRIDYHPQLEPRTVPKACTLTDRVFQPGQPLSFLDWRAHNLSLPREAVLEAGGFSEALPFGGLEAMELAYRLESDLGMRGYFCDQAQAFLWKPEPLANEERRYYAEGYWLHHLVQTTQAEALEERYKRVVSAWRRGADPLFLPLAHRLCPMLAFNSRFYNRFRRGVLRSAFRRGYRDARRGRPAALLLSKAAPGGE
ncbi:MAG: glycosyltransferase [Candidatus Hydrogenedentota bacterium]